MRVRIHPNQHEIKAGSEACISVTPERKRARTYHMGTVVLSDVTFRVHASGVKRVKKDGVKNVHAWMVGDLLHESIERASLLNRRLIEVTYNNDGRFIAADGTDVTDGSYDAGYAVGPKVYISKEW